MEKDQDNFIMSITDNLMEWINEPVSSETLDYYANKDSTRPCTSKLATVDLQICDLIRLLKFHKPALAKQIESAYEQLKQEAREKDIMYELLRVNPAIPKEELNPVAIKGRAWYFARELSHIAKMLKAEKRKKAGKEKVGRGG
jgi:hypothetical protein